MPPNWSLEVRTVKGASTSLTVDSSQTVASVKARLAERELRPSAEGLSVLFLGHVLADDATLERAGVTADDYLVSVWKKAKGKKRKKRSKEQPERTDASKRRRSSEADDNDDLYSGFGRDHGVATAAEQQLVQPDENAGARAAAMGGVVGWLGEAVGGLSDKDTLACAGWLSRAGCDSAASLRLLPKAVILKHTPASSTVRTKLLIAAGYLDASSAPPSPSTGTTQRLVATGPEAAAAGAAAPADDGAEITDPKVTRAPPPPRPPPPAAIRGVQVEVNRGPVMVMWAAAVALKLGHSRDTALSLARAVTNAFSRHKAKHLGIELQHGGKASRAVDEPGAKNAAYLPFCCLLRQAQDKTKGQLENKEAFLREQTAAARCG